MFSIRSLAAIFKMASQSYSPRLWKLFYSIQNIKKHIVRHITHYNRQNGSAYITISVFNYGRWRPFYKMASQSYSPRLWNVYPRHFYWGGMILSKSGEIMGVVSGSLWQGQDYCAAELKWLKNIYIKKNSHILLMKHPPQIISSISGKFYMLCILSKSLCIRPWQHKG